MFVGVKRLLSASKVAEIGCDLISVPERKNEEGDQTGQERGSYLEKNEGCASEPS